MNEPNLDQWTTSFTLVAFLGFFITPLLMSQAGQRRSQVRYIAAILVSFSVLLLYYVLFWSGYIRYFPYLMGSLDLLYFLFGPFFYLYLKSLSEQPVSNSPQSVHFVPFLVGVSINLVVIAVRFRYPELLMHPSRLPYVGYYFKVLPWICLAHLTVYAVAIVRLRQSFGELHTITSWARWVSVCYLGFVVALGAYYGLVQFSFFSRAWDYAISFSMAGFIGLVAVLAYVQPHIFQSVDPPVIPPEPKLESEIRYRHSGMPAHVASQFAGQLQGLMQTEKLYQDCELRLDTLAEKLTVSRHHLSQILNEQLGMNFFEYINSLRVEEAKELLRQVPRQELNISEVAYQVGFNNKVSFNKAFRKATGLSPKEFRQATQEKTALSQPFAGKKQLL
jgi:AraC-like DNA-binding protein